MVAHHPQGAVLGQVQRRLAQRRPHPGLLDLLAQPPHLQCADITNCKRVAWSSQDAQRASTRDIQTASQGVQSIKGVHGLPNDYRLPTTVMFEIPRSKVWRLESSVCLCTPQTQTRVPATTGLRLRLRTRTAASATAPAPRVRLTPACVRHVVPI
eukprot:1181955-Prorocentrum_minimum.AAC.2